MQNYGVSVPNDVSIVGFDDIEMAQAARPTLTTNHVYREWLGQVGIRLLLARIRDPERPVMALTVDTAFVIRDSTCAR